MGTRSPVPRVRHSANGSANGSAKSERSPSETKSVKLDLLRPYQRDALNSLVKGVPKLTLEEVERLRDRWLAGWPEVAAFLRKK